MLEIKINFLSLILLKDLFVYKDFELHGVNLINAIPEPKIEKEDSIVANTLYTIQLGAYLYPTRKYEKLKYSHTVYEDLNKNIYTYFYGNFNNINDANVNFKKLKQLGYKNIFIIKKRK